MVDFLLDHSNLWLTPFLSSLISLSVLFDQGVYGSNWFQVTCNIIELLVKVTLDYLFGIVTYTCWWDPIPNKQQWQGLMCFTSGCHREISSKVWGTYLCTSVATSGHCTGKYFVWEYRMCDATIMKIAIIWSESSQQQWMENSFNPSLSCCLCSLLSFLWGNDPSFG